MTKDVLSELRILHEEICTSGECEMMALVRRGADEIEALRAECQRLLARGDKAELELNSLKTHYARRAAAETRTVVNEGTKTIRTSKERAYFALNIRAAISYIDNRSRWEGAMSPDREALIRLVNDLEAQAAETPAVDPDSWEENAKCLLNRCPYTIHVREGGGPENLKHSLVHTFTAMEQKLELWEAACTGRPGSQSPCVKPPAPKASEPHTHVWTLEPEGAGGAICVCGRRPNGWYCPDSPDHLCHYDKGDFDQCDFCGQPEERK